LKTRKKAQKIALRSRAKRKRKSPLLPTAVIKKAQPPLAKKGQKKYSNFRSIKVNFANKSAKINL